MTAHQTFRCAFCGSPGRRSKEHIIALWLHEYLGTLPPTYSVRGMGMGLNEGGSAYARSESENRVLNKPFLQQKTRNVCEKCNNGWMSQVETDARPTIVRLLAAANGDGAVVLSREEAAILAVWSVKTAFTLELLSAGDNVGSTFTTQEMRETLRGRELPTGTFVALCRCSDNEGNVSYTQAFLETDRSSPPNPNERPRRIMAVGLQLLNLAIVVLTGDRRNTTPNLGIAERTLVWPYLPGDFPPPVSLTSARIQRSVGDQPSLFHQVPYDPAGLSDPAGPRHPGKKRGPQAGA